MKIMKILPFVLIFFSLLDQNLVQSETTKEKPTERPKSDTRVSRPSVRALVPKIAEKREASDAEWDVNSEFGRRFKSFRGDKFRPFDAEKSRRSETEKFRTTSNQKNRRSGVEKFRTIDTEKSRSSETLKIKLFEAEKTNAFEAEKTNAFEAEKSNAFGAEKFKQRKAEKSNRFTAEDFKPLEAEKFKSFEAEKTETSKPSAAEIFKPFEAEKFKPLDIENNIKSAESAPSQLLEPPFTFYSSSIRNFEPEPYRATTFRPETTEAPPTDISATSVKRLRIYEITTGPTTERSFVISDPSNEIQSYNSLRSVFMNSGNKNRNKLKNVGKSNSFDDKLRILNPKTDVIKANSLKGYPSRGNRKYQQHDSDSDEMTETRNSWGVARTRYTYAKIPRPNTVRFIDSNVKIGAVPGIPGRDYPIHQEHIHLQLRNTARRFTCPVDADSHIYLADRASRCQIFYVCFGTNTGIPMVCPNGTLFSEELGVCDWWFNVIC